MQLRRNVLPIAVAGILATLVLPGAAALAGDPAKPEVKLLDGGGVWVVTTDQDGGRREVMTEVFGGSGGFLGVRLDPDEEAPDGARIDRVIEDSPAERAGLREGDVIVRLGGHSIGGADDLIRRVGDLEPGDLVDLEILRDGARRTLSAELGEHKSAWAFDFDFDLQGLKKLGDLRELKGLQGLHGLRGLQGLEGLTLDLDDLEGFDAEELGERMRELGETLGELKLDIGALPDRDGTYRFSFGGQRPRLGVQLVPTTRELREHLGGSGDAGALVSKVLPGTPAEAAGIVVGDLIVAANGLPIRGVGDLTEKLAEHSGETIELEVIREGRSLRLDVRLEDDDAPTRLRSRRSSAGAHAPRAYTSTRTSSLTATPSRLAGATSSSAEAACTVAADDCAPTCSAPVQRDPHTTALPYDLSDSY